MSISIAFLLGIIQGLTEFLPVSSSGHLVLFQKIFGVSQPALFFDTMVHAGTLVAVVIVLWPDILAILRRILQPLTWYLILATIPAVIFALVLKDTIEQAFESGQFLGFAFLATALLLIIAELLARRVNRGSFRRPLASLGPPYYKTTGIQQGSMNWLDALIIGLLQAIAIIPGISRSGATLSGALSRRLNRDFAARFSFLLSIPAILGALVLQIKDLVQESSPVQNIIETAGGIGTAAIIAGTVSAALTGFFAVRLMLKIVREKSLWGFAIYTGILGLLVLIDQFGTHFVF